ncbi:anti-sigma factor antagonist [Rhodococcus sp. 14-2686-1-2]|nr:anti-sigma factor antagonist [Rhodococcus sp. 15-1189-1-1a]OZF18607.1 anti-sigma factor antagonist [Rhodococcus sp. 14-2686-1-2]
MDIAEECVLVVTDDADPAPFRAVLTSTGRTRVLTVDGELDMSVVPDLAAAAFGAAAEAEGGLVVDLTDAAFLSSSAITTLVKTSEHLPQGAVMALVATRPVVLRPIELSGIDRFMQAFPELASAIAHVSGHHSDAT